MRCPVCGSRALSVNVGVGYKCRRCGYIHEERK